MVKLYLILVIIVVVLLALPSTRATIGRITGLADRDNRRRMAEQAREQATRAAEGARYAAGATRDAAGSAATVARGAAESVRGAGESVAQGITDRRMRTLGRTFVVEGDPAVVKPVIDAAMESAAVVDPSTPGPDEVAAWVYSGFGDVRFVATAGPAGAIDAEGVAVPTTVVGVRSWEYALGEPQGVGPTGQTLDKVAEALTAAGLRWTETVRTFEPGPDDTSEGTRTRV